MAGDGQLLPGTPLPLVQQGRLPESRLGDDRRDPPGARTQPVQEADELVELVLAADESVGGRSARVFAPVGGRSERPDRFGLALDLHEPEVLGRERPVGEGEGPLRYLDRPGFGGLLHAGSDVDRIAQRGVLDPEVRPDLADDHQAGVDADPHVDLDAVPGSDGRLRTGHRLDDVEPCPDSPDRVVLVGDRGAEESEDGVAEEAGERPLVAVDRLDEVLEGRVHEVGPVLGIHLFGGRRRSLHVGEEHGDGASLAGHGPTGARRLELGEHLGRDEATQPVVDGRCRLGAQARPAVVAEVGVGLVGGAAGRAGDAEGRAAVGAELRSGVVLEVADGTVHGRLPGCVRHATGSTSGAARSPGRQHEEHVGADESEE